MYRITLLSDRAPSRWDARTHSRNAVMNGGCTRPAHIGGCPARPCACRPSRSLESIVSVHVPWESSPCGRAIVTQHRQSPEILTQPSRSFRPTGCAGGVVWRGFPLISREIVTASLFLSWECVELDFRRMICVVPVAMVRNCGQTWRHIGGEGSRVLACLAGECMNG